MIRTNLDLNNERAPLWLLVFLVIVVAATVFNDSRVRYCAVTRSLARRRRRTNRAPKELKASAEDPRIGGHQ
jgi:hypothetical protein